ncbi:hypothetical protein N0V90_009921 [Kalmusia sp. IMI 367209]|nr:hypothetical protein N0V90_009921 [Kalmusia sp. IMI 367209]
MQFILKSSEHRNGAFGRHSHASLSQSKQVTTATMDTTIFLPAPIASGSMRLGQLLTNPLHPSHDSFINEYDTLPTRAPSVQENFKESIARDDGGRLIGSLHGRSYALNENSVNMKADQMTYITLRDSLSAFRYTCRRASSQAFLHKMALRRQPLYFVTAIRKLTNPKFTNRDGNFAASKPQVRRKDSGVSLNELDGDVILTIELRKVTCRIGSPEAPQEPSDVGYAWKHYRLQGENDLQLAVGFGRPIEAAEFRTIVGISSDSDYTDESADSDDFDDDDEAGGFCSASIANSAYRRY